MYKVVEDYENLKLHQKAVSAALQCSMGKDIGTCINRNLAFKHLEEIEQRRLVIKRLKDVIFFIGRQRLPFRSKEKGAYSLNEIGKHDNFLE